MKLLSFASLIGALFFANISFGEIVTKNMIGATLETKDRNGETRRLALRCEDEECSRAYVMLYRKDFCSGVNASSTCIDGFLPFISVDMDSLKNGEALNFWYDDERKDINEEYKKWTIGGTIYSYYMANGFSTKNGSVSGPKPYLAATFPLIVVGTALDIVKSPFMGIAYGSKRLGIKVEKRRASRLLKLVLDQSRRGEIVTVKRRHYDALNNIL